MITNEQLDAAGYRKHNATQAYQHSDYFYQKRFADELGIKYFIQFVHYPSHKFENGQTMPESWMMELNNNEPHYTFQWHKADSIMGGEVLCEVFFKSMGCQYYELYENQRA